MYIYGCTYTALLTRNNLLAFVLHKGHNVKCKYAKLIDKLSLYSLYQILTKYKVIWSEDLSIGSGSYGVHCARLQIDQDGPRDVFPTGGFIVVDVDSLELEIGVTIVATGRINAVFIGNHFPELKKLNIIYDKIFF